LGQRRNRPNGPGREEKGWLGQKKGRGDFLFFLFISKSFSNLFKRDFEILLNLNKNQSPQINTCSSMDAQTCI